MKTCDGKYQAYGATVRTLRGASVLIAGLLFAAMAQVLAQQAPPLSHWMQEGASALKQGDAKAAELDFRQALLVAPRSADATLGMGLAQLREGKFADAEVTLAKASELDPAVRGAHMFRGIAIFQLNLLDEAVDELNKEIVLQPNSSEALTWLGIIDLQSGKPKEACIPLDRAGELAPKDENILYYQVRAHTLAAQEAFRALFKIDGDSAYLHRAQAEIFSESHQLDKAIVEYQAAIKKSPTNAELYEALGNEEQLVSRPAEAAAAYQKELTINPNSAVALFNLGKIRIETGNAEEGIALLQRAIAANAMAAPTDFYLGLGMVKLGKDQEAVGWLEKSLSASPSDMIRQRADFELVRVYQRLGRKQDSERMLVDLKKLKGQTVPTVEPN